MADKTGRGRASERGAGERPAMGDVRYVVMDTELTGLDEKRDAVIAIGAVRMVGARIELGDSFSRLIKPPVGIKASSAVIHQITPSELADQPTIDTVLTEFLAFCGDDVMVGYCIGIDAGFLNRETRRLYGRPLPNSLIDTAVLFERLRRRAHPDTRLARLIPTARLYDIAASLGIPLGGAHNALIDAFITAQVFQRFLPLLSEDGCERIDELLKAGDPSRKGDAGTGWQETCNM